MIFIFSLPILAEELLPYQVVWTTPGKNVYEMMPCPLGNGEIAVNVWIDELGDLKFDIARIDSLDEKRADTTLFDIKFPRYRGVKMTVSGLTEVPLLS